MPVPGGYLVYIVMEKVRRVSLENFWRYPRDKRDKIRDAFAKSLEYVCFLALSFYRQKLGFQLFIEILCLRVGRGQN